MSTPCYYCEEERGMACAVCIHGDMGLDDALRMQAELAEKREVIAGLIVARDKYHSERDEARGRVEKLREVAKAATDRLVCDASCPARITGAEVDCTCGLVAVYDALDAALAECGEG